MVAAMKQSQWTVSQSTHAVCGGKITLMRQTKILCGQAWTKLPVFMPTCAVAKTAKLPVITPLCAKKALTLGSVVARRLG
jgi:hypothetical protein